MALRWFISGCSLALTIGLAALEAHAEVAAKSWDSALLTKDSTDHVSSVIAAGSGKDEYIYIAGGVSSPRGQEIGLQGLVKTGKHNRTEQATKESYTDGFVAKIEAASKKLVWVFRYEVGKDSGEKSKFFDVTVDAANRVYAVGHQKSKKTRSYAPLLAILDGSSGDVKTTIMHDEGIKGNAHYSAVAIHGEDVYICGSDTSGNAGGNKNVDPAADKVEGGLVVARASADNGKILWSRQAGQSRLRDRCSGMAVADSGTELFVSTTIYPVADGGVSSPRTTGQVAVYAVGAVVGDLTWKAEMPRGKTVQDISHGIAVDDDSVFVSSSKWTDVFRGKRMYLHKLARDTGTQLFARETCCGQLLSKLPDGDYQSKGSAEPGRGLYIGGDGFVYQVGAYRARKASTDDAYASVVVRTSIFGQQNANADISGPIETFKYEAYKPLMLAAASDGLIAVERTGDLTGTDADAHNAKLTDVKLQPVDVSRQARYRAKSGAHYAQIRAKLAPVSDTASPLKSIAAVVADLTRLHAAQVSATADEKDDVTVVTATVYGDRPNVEGSPGAHDVLRRMKEVLAGAASRPSDLEAAMGLRAGVLASRATPTVVASGRTADLGGVAQAGEDGRGLQSKGKSAGAGDAGDAAPAAASSKGKKKVLSTGVIAAIAVGAGVALVAGIGLIAFAVKR